MPGTNSESASTATSGFDIVLTLAQHVDALHAMLDAFAEDRTSQLSGKRTRNEVGDALDGLDFVVRHLQRDRHRGSSDERGYIPAELLAPLAAANRDFRELIHALPSADYDRHAEPLGRLHDDLSRMNRLLELDPRDQGDDAPSPDDR